MDIIIRTKAGKQYQLLRQDKPTPPTAGRSLRKSAAGA